MTETQHRQTCGLCTGSILMLPHQFRRKTRKTSRLQLPTYADNVALPAFARRTSHVAAIDRHLLSAWPQQGQTDRLAAWRSG